MAGKGDGGVSGESESIADKYFVCTECLVEGNVQSFVDLFYLTHALDGADNEEEETLALARSVSSAGGRASRQAGVGEGCVCRTGGGMHIATWRALQQTC